MESGLQPVSSDLPDELWRKIAELAGLTSAARMSRASKPLQAAVSRLLDCKRIIKDGRYCFTERKPEDSKTTYRNICPVECAHYKTKYVEYILRLIEFLVGDNRDNEYMLLTEDGRLLPFNTSAHVDTSQNSIVYEYYTRQWLQHVPDQIDPVPISRQQVAEIIVHDGQIVGDMLLSGNGKFPGYFSIVRVEEGVPRRVAPIFDYLRFSNLHTLPVAQIHQNLEGPEMQRTGSPPDSPYLVEESW